MATDIPADYRWLVSPAAAPWLAIASQAGGSDVQRAARLRRDLSAERTHLVLEQVALRLRARHKFSAAERMFFTRLGLEQATGEELADIKGRRFPPGAAVADICCGIGGDLLALARRGPTVGIDRDPIATLLAEANAAVVGSVASGPSVPNSSSRAQPSHFGLTLLTTGAEQADVAGLAGWHIDPDRRPTGQRTTRAVDHDPPPASIERLLALCPQGAVKLAPAAELPASWAERAELEWFSHRRECRQLVAWFGNLAQRPGTRRATVGNDTSTGTGRSGELALPRSVCGQPDLAIPSAEQVDRFVYDPDPAVLAAGLSGALAAEHGLQTISARCGYLTGSYPVNDPALAGFEVLDVLPLRVGPIRRWLAEQRMGRLEIKKRGVEIDPRELHRQLQVPGDEAGVILLMKLDARAIAIIAQRLAHEGPPPAV
jgi:hypothetical protein